MRKRPMGRHWIALWRSVVGTRWDLVVDLRGSAIAWLLRSKDRKVAKRYPGHRVAAAARVLGLDPPLDPQLFVGAPTRARAEQILGEGAVLAVGPSANWIGKEWPWQNFAELARRLTAPDAPLFGAKILLLGAPEDRARLKPLRAALSDRPVIDEIGRLDLLTVHACLRKAALFVGNDSGLMHLAAAAGAPTLGLFGPSDEAAYAPWGPHCASVRGSRSFAELTAPPFDFSGRECHMFDLSVDDVERAALELLNRVGSTEPAGAPSRP